MLRPKRRLFRRRSSWEWITDNAYVGVALLALAGGVVGWTSLFDAKGPHVGNAPADLAAESVPAAAADAVTAPEPESAAASEPSAAAAATPLPSTTAAPIALTAVETKPALASTSAAPRAARSTLAAIGRRMRQWQLSVNAKSHPVARASRRVRSSLVAVAVVSRHARARLPRVSARHRTYASTTRTRVRAHEDYLDRAYDTSASSESSRPPPQNVESSANIQIEHAVSPADCSRLYRVFGGTRRVRAECPAGEAPDRAE